jgi:hypothetical protein
MALVTAFGLKNNKNMGVISSFNLHKFISEYQTRQYVETGLGVGECLKTAISYPFQKIFSAELDPEFVENLRQLEEDPRVQIICGKSTDVLKQILPQLDESPTLFWLDAHLPFGDFKKISYEESIRTYLQDCFPLEEEMQIIKAGRNASMDVIIIDDAALYYEGLDCEHIRSNGDFPHRDLVKELGLKLEHSFVQEMFKETHDLNITSIHQGHFILTPK